DRTAHHGVHQVAAAHHAVTAEQQQIPGDDVRVRDHRRPSTAMACSRNWASSTTTPPATATPTVTLSTPTTPAENSWLNWPRGNRLDRNAGPATIPAHPIPANAPA